MALNSAAFSEGDAQKSHLMTGAGATSLPQPVVRKQPKEWDHSDYVQGRRHSGTRSRVRIACTAGDGERQVSRKSEKVLGPASPGVCRQAILA
jgi:hypothetical protein